MVDNAESQVCGEDCDCGESKLTDICTQIKLFLLILSRDFTLEFLGEYEKIFDGFMWFCDDSTVGTSSEI